MRSGVIAVARNPPCVRRASAFRWRRVLVVGTALLHDRAQVLTQLLEGWSADEPPTVIDAVDGQVGIQRERVRQRHQTVLEARRRLLDDVDRTAWRSAASALLAEDFCESVESGVFMERLAEWR